MPRGTSGWNCCCEISFWSLQHLSPGVLPATVFSRDWIQFPVLGMSGNLGCILDILNNQMRDSEPCENALENVGIFTLAGTCPGWVRATSCVPASVCSGSALAPFSRLWCAACSPHMLLSSGEHRACDVSCSAWRPLLQVSAPWGPHTLRLLGVLHLESQGFSQSLSSLCCHPFQMTWALLRAAQQEKRQENKRGTLHTHALDHRALCPVPLSIQVESPAGSQGPKMPPKIRPGQD